MKGHPMLLNLIHLGQHTTIENNNAFRESLHIYLKQVQDEALAHALKEMDLYHTKDTYQYFYPAHFRAMSILYDHAGFTPAYVQRYAKAILPDDPYINYIMELAMKAEPKDVKIENWSPSHCPTCGAELSTHHGDGYFTHSTFLEHCPHCQQALKWPE